MGIFIRAIAFPKIFSKKIFYSDRVFKKFYSDVNFLPKKFYSDAILGKIFYSDANFVERCKFQKNTVLFAKKIYMQFRQNLQK